MLSFVGRFHSAQRQARIRPSAVLAVASLLLINAACIPQGAQAAVEPVRASIADGKLVAGRSANVTVAVNIEEGWHINSTSPEQKFLIATSLDWQLPTGVMATQVRFPSPIKRRLALAGDKELELFEGDISVRATLIAAADADVSAAALAVLHYQACNDSVCLRPATIELAVDWVGDEQTAGLFSRNAEARRIAAGAAAGPWVGVALTVGGLGTLCVGVALLGVAMGLVATPYVRPLVVLLPVYVGRQADVARGVWLFFLLALGLALPYVVPQRPRGRFQRIRGRVPGYNGPDTRSDAFCRQWLFISPAAYFPIKSSVG